MNNNSFYCGSSSNLPCQLARLDQVPEQYVHPATKICNYIYTHPTEKQCNYTPDLSNVNASKLQGYTYQQIVDAAVSKSASLTTLYDKIVSINVTRSKSNTELMLTRESDLPQDFVAAFNAKAINSIFTIISYSNLSLTFTMHREWSSNGSIGLAVRTNSYNYSYILATTIGNGTIQQDVPYSGTIQGLVYAKPIFHDSINKTADENIGLYIPALYCTVSRNSADKYYSISGSFRCKIQSLQLKL